MIDDHHSAVVFLGVVAEALGLLDIYAGGVHLD